jgi:hypothetical protein
MVFRANSVHVREPPIFRKRSIHFGTNSGERAVQQRITWLFFVRAIVGSPGFPWRTRCRWLINRRKKQQKQPVEAEGDSLRGGNPAMLPTPPGGSTNRAIRRSPN